MITYQNGKKYFKVNFPDKFILKKEYKNDAIKHITNMLQKDYQNYILDFSGITETTESEIMVISAQLEKSKENGNIFFRGGALPQPKKIRALFGAGNNANGGLVHVNIKNVNDFEKARQLVPTVIDNVVLELKKIGIKEYYYDFNVFLTELIGNAVEHGIKDRSINWWLHHKVNKDRTITFAFVDMGRGIIKSHKKAKLPWKYYFLPDNRIVLDSFKGRLGSSTKLDHRGRGLPQLFDMIKRDFVSNVVLITNNVSLYFNGEDVKTGKNTNFVGTYYSWTINQNNFQKWKNTK